MESYRKPYCTLFHAMTTSVEKLEEMVVLESLPEHVCTLLQREISRLKLAQIDAEEKFLVQE